MTTAWVGHLSICFERPATLSKSRQAWGLLANDAVHLRYAIQTKGAVLTHNYGDFKELHDLLHEAAGRHFGILVVHKDNNPKRDLSASGIVRAIQKLLASGVPSENCYHILNHWR
jgi:hypothetical protein